MRYLEDTDISVFCDEMERRVISEHPDQWLASEEMAIEFVGSYLRGRYDYGRVISMRHDRNPMVTQAIAVVAIWNLVHRLPMNMGYERRREMYDETILWLKDVQAGRSAVNLPTYNDERENDLRNPIRYGSMEKNNYDY